MRSLLIANVFLVCVSILNAQTDKQNLNRANDEYKNHHYAEASQYYELVWNIIQKDKTSLLQAGICSYESGKLDFANQCLNKLLELSDSFEQIANLYLAKTHQFKNEFDEAIVCYKKYLKASGSNDAAKAYIRNELLRCEEGLRYKRKTPLAIVESIGNLVNTREDEYAPVQHPKENGLFYFSAIRNDNKGGKRDKYGNPDSEKGHLRSDIFKLNQLNGKWSISEIRNSEFNSNMDDQVLGFKDKGSTMIFYRSWNDEKGIILLDSLNTGTALNYKNYNSPAIAEIGDHNFNLFQDSILIFSSSRIGGYGGYDLYISVLRNDQWTPAMNLGPMINSAFNEDFPFLAKDGRTLYFSSDNLKSMGGYDIFKTTYLPEAQHWSVPINLGIPINSAGIDQYFKLTNDGLFGIFSSDRKINNLGGQDIYLAFFKEELTEQLSESNGTVLTYLIDSENTVAEIKPVESKMTNGKKRNNEVIKTYTIESINYSDENYLSESKNQKSLNEIINLLKEHNNLKIQLIAHSNLESQDAVNLFSSIKKAEDLKKYFESNHISSQRIQCFGLGASWPIANEKINGNVSTVSIKLNKRIEINLPGADSTKLNIHYSTPMVSELIKSDKQGTFQNLRSGLSYSLFLGGSETVLSHPMIHFSEGLLFVEKIKENKYNYYFGVYKTFKEAESVLNKYQSQFKTTLEIKAFNSGEELSRKDIINHVLKDADLLLYLNYLNRKQAGEN